MRPIGLGAQENLLYPTKCLEDLVPGEQFDLGSLNIDEAEMAGFAVKFDPQPHHVDQHAEETIALGGLIASGMFTLSVCHEAAFNSASFRTQSWGWELTRSDGLIPCVPVTPSTAGSR